MIVAVTGCEGLVGAACVRGLCARGHPVIALSRAALAIEDRAAVAVFMTGKSLDAVVCSAARPHVEGCEHDPAGTRKINVDATVALARAATARGAMFVAFSSEYVFDGVTDLPYTEDNARNPVNEYGRQKRDLEEALVELPRTLVIRTSGVYGVESKRKNFVYQLVDKANAGQPVRVPNDQLITPTYADNLGDLVAQTIERGVGGILHVAGPEPMSRVAFAHLIARSFDLPGGVVVPCPSASLQLLAPRPPRAALSVDKARRLTLSPFITPQEGLARMRESVANTSR